MRVLVTGANGFIGKNLIVNINAEELFSVLKYSHENTVDELGDLVEQADVVVHLAGENRPKDTEWAEFSSPDFATLKSILNAPIIFDGRNLYDLEKMNKLGFRYKSIGRSEVLNKKEI